MFGYFLMGIGGLSIIILVIGFAVVMFIAARDLWKAGSLVAVVIDTTN